MKRLAFFFCLALLCLLCLPALGERRRQVRLAVYQNPPLVFRDAASGRVEGIFPAVLRAVAKNNDWRVSYVYGTWQQCLARLEKGEVDLLGAIGASSERAARFDFSRETVLTNWGQVYTPAGKPLESLLALDKKRLAVLRDDVYYEYLKPQLEKFGLSVRYVPVESYSEVLDLLDKGRADAGLLNHLAGSRLEKGRAVERSPIVFNPVEVRFAAPKGRYRAFLTTLDRDLARMKARQGSVYQRAMDRWLKNGRQSRTPFWLWWAVGGGLALLALAAIYAILLKSLVKIRTAELAGKNLALREEIAERRRTEELLKTSEEKFAKAFRALPAWFTIATVADGLILDANEGFSAVSGFSRERAVGARAQDLGLFKYKQDRDALMAELMSRGSVREKEITLFRANGEPMVGLWSAETLQLDGQDCIISVVVDITEWKEAQKRLGLNQERLALALEVGGAGIFDHSVPVDSGFHLSEGWATLLGILPEDLPDEAVFEWFKARIHPEDLPKVLAHFTQLVDGEINGYQTEFRALHSNGQYRLLKAVARTVERDEERRVKRVIGVVTDVTEAKEAEAALVQSEERFRMLFDSISDLVYTQDLSGRFISVNAAVCRNLGYQAREMLGRKASDFIRRELANDFENEYLPSINANGRHAGVAPYVTKDGKVRYVEYDSILVTPEKGEPYISGSGRDVTERIKSERQIKRLGNQLLQSQKMEAVGTLAGGIAHDFNNILAAIMGFTELARADLEKDHPARANLEEVLNAGQRAKDLIQQILSFSRPSDHLHKPVRLIPLLKEALKLLRSSLPTTVEIQQGFEVSHDLVKADPTQIHQLLMNLCTNAAHAMEETGGVLRVGLARSHFGEHDPRPAPELSPGDYLVLSVADTGPGIEPALVGRIFEPFFTTKRAGQGSGMGLAVVHGIVKGHDGAITLSNRPGQGVTFRVYLPVLEEEPEEETALDSKPLPRGSERILFVDDEQALVEVGGAMLSRLGYRVTALNSSVEALSRFRQDPQAFDLVLTDQTMPKMTGLEMAQAILTERPDLPVILCTGYSGRVTPEALDQVGIARFLLKPLDLPKLARAVAETLAQAREKAQKARERDSEG